MVTKISEINWKKCNQVSYNRNKANNWKKVPAVVDHSSSPRISQPPLKRFKRLAQDIMDRNSPTNSIEDDLASCNSAVKSHAGNNALEFCSFPLAPLAKD